MIKYRKLIVIGGTGRNVGKTEFGLYTDPEIFFSITCLRPKSLAIPPDEAIFRSAPAISEDEPNFH